MPYLGNKPVNNFVSFAKQDITGNGGTSYSLDYPVTGANDIELFINNVRQEPTEAYSCSGSTLTLTGAITSTDDVYVIFRGRALGTVNPPDDSVSADIIQDNAVTSAKIQSDAVTTAKIADSNITSSKLASSSVTSAKLATDAVNNFDKVSELYREGPLTGTFANIYWTNGATPDDEIWIDQYGTRLEVSNGNNGPSARARVRGVASGNFFLQLYLGYSWGWSEIYMVEPSNMNENACYRVSTTPAGQKLFSMRNNNSNNNFTASWWDGSSSSTVHTSSGYSYGTRYTIWRNGTNLYLAIGTTNYTLDTNSTEDFVFHTGQQSPFNVYLQGATGQAAF